MSLIHPTVLLLLLPLVLAGVLARSTRFGWAGRLPGGWDQVISPRLKAHAALRSGLGRAGAPVLCLGIAALLITALARPGIDADRTEAHATLAGRVVVLDVGAELDAQRLFLDALNGAGRMPATAVVVATGEAYRIVPFTTDTAQIDRYVRVLRQDMMPVSGHRPHLGLAEAERILAAAGLPVRQIVFITSTLPPETMVPVPGTGSERIIVALGSAGATGIWARWAEGWDASLAGRGSADDIAQALEDAARAAARAELPAARLDLSSALLAVAALFWLLLFRRRAS